LAGIGRQQQESNKQKYKRAVNTALLFLVRQFQMIQVQDASPVPPPG
jgi:hypothetical protein